MTEIRPAFLLSLPRSGSTLLQRMLGAHPAISTRAEPWLLLPLLSALDENGVYTRYNHRVAQGAMAAFAQHLPDGEDALLAHAARYALGLYEQAADPGADVFLDKTPRYGLYMGRLLRAFPSAPMIVLWRNPLSILASLSRSFTEDQWMPHHHIVDLYDLLEGLAAAVDHTPDRFLQVRYEDLVRDPETTLRRVLEHLDLPWHERVAQDFATTDVSGPVGDMSVSGTLATLQTVATTSTDRWHEVLASPVRKRWAMRYLDWIGPDRLATMGYDHRALRRALADTPTRWSTVPADVYYAVKGVAWRLIEPQILKDKWSRRGTGTRITSHT